MLEFLTRWTPLAQFLGPLVAALAALFAWRSAGAARLTAAAARASQLDAAEERVRTIRPEVRVEMISKPTTYQFAVRNTHEWNNARRIRVEVRKTRKEEWRAGLWVWQLRPGDMKPGRIRKRSKDEPNGDMLGRLTYQDADADALWQQTFFIKEEAAKWPDGLSYFEYSVPEDRVGQLRRLQKSGTSREGLPTRARHAWKVLVGRV